VLRALSRLVYRRRGWVLALFAAFVAVSIVFGVDALAHLKNGGFEDPACESYLAKEALREHLGLGDGTLVVLYESKRGLRATDPAFRDAVQESVGRVRGVRDVGGITTLYNTGAQVLVSTDGKLTFALVALQGDEARLLALAKDLRPLLASDTLDVKIGGYPAVFTEMNDQAAIDLRRAELLGLPVVAVLLVIIFRSIVASLLPLIVGVTSIFGGMFMLRVAGAYTDVSIFAANLVSMLGLGLAIDYSLFVVSRFREELAAGKGVPEALETTMDTAGRTILFSGVTVAISLLALEVFPVMFLRSMGHGGAAAAGIAVITSLTLLPAVLGVLGKKVNALPVGWRPLAQGADETSGFWYRQSRFVMRHPWAITGVTIVGLALMGVPFLHARFAIPDARTLPAGCEARKVGEAISTRFARNETEPIQIVARAEGPALEQAALSALYDYAQALRSVPGVRRIDSLVTLNAAFRKSDYLRLYSPTAPPNAIAKLASSRFAKGEYALLTVLYDGDPNAPEALALVRALRAVAPPASLRVQVGGTPAALADFLHTVAVGIPRASAIIVAVVFVLLFLMLGSLVIPLKAVLLNILSLSVSFGALVWIFQDGHLSGLLAFTSMGAIDGAMPVLIFSIAFGLSMDYEVFLLSRIKEHYDKTGDAEGSVALGVQKTGGIITSAALLLVIVIASFATGEIIFVKQIGIGLGLAILVDATVVRMLLVPAAMQLMGKYNWWAPRCLARLHRQLGLSELVDP